MKCRNFALLCFLMPILTFFSPPLFGAELLLYSIDSPEVAQKELPYLNWRGKRSGIGLYLTTSMEERLGRDSLFKLSVATAPSKGDFCTILGERVNTSDECLSIRELFLLKRNFLIEDLTLRAGRGLFEIPTLFKDYLWGGRFTYRIRDGLSLEWQQIAGYEGRYLLFGGSEDDIDIFSLGVKGENSSFGIYRIMEARGPLAASLKQGLFASYKDENFSLEAASQSGELGAYGKLNLKGLFIEAGYASKNFSSYGFREKIRDFSLVYKPSFKDILFWRLSFKGLYFLEFRDSYGRDAKREFGIEADFSPTTSSLKPFVRAAVGSAGGYALFFGIKSSTELSGEEIEVEKFSLKTVGEYADLPQRDYKAQKGYEEWSYASHVGYWHTSLKISLTDRDKDFKATLSTGPSTQRDFLIWGNSGDNYLYETEGEKLFHLEEVWWQIPEGAKVGLLRVSSYGLFDESFTGISLFKEKLLFLRKGRDNFLSAKLLSGHLEALASSNKEGYLTLKTSFRGSALIYQKKRRNSSWGAYLTLEKSLNQSLKGKLLYLIYSKEFSTLNLRESFRDVGYIFRPSEEDERLLKLSLSIEAPVSLRLFYLNLSSFSGKYVGEEAGFRLTILKKPLFSLKGSLGSGHTFYYGVELSARW